MKRETTVAVVTIAACCALVLAALAMAFLAYPRAGLGVLRRYAVVIVAAHAIAAVVGYLLARFAVSMVARESVGREARLRRYLAETGHELRTPLAVVAASLDALHRIAPSDAVVQTLHDGLRQELRRMSALVQDVLLLARLDAVRRPQVAARIDVDAMLGELAEEARRLPGGTEVRLRADSGARVVADPTALREAVRNLIDNARKYAPGAAIDLQATRAGDAVRLVVRDHGPGMDAADNALAFERYYRGAAAEGVEGSGLGLAIVRAAARSAGGEALISSAPGAGTAVTLRLPLARE